jgi:hypothetical protein
MTRPQFKVGDFVKLRQANKQGKGIMHFIPTYKIIKVHNDTAKHQT